MLNLEKRLPQRRYAKNYMWYLQPELWFDLQRVARKVGLPVSELLRRCAADAIERIDALPERKP